MIPGRGAVAGCLTVLYLFSFSSLGVRIRTASETAALSGPACRHAMDDREVDDGYREDDAGWSTGMYFWDAGAVPAVWDEDLSAEEVRFGVRSW